MKYTKILCALALLLGAIGTAGAQVNNESLTVTNAPPSGPCNVQAQVFKVTNQGLWQCVTNTWTKIAPATGSGFGTVQSVGLQLPAALFSVSGSPVTGTGDLVGTFIPVAPNTFLAGPPSGGAGTPTIRAIVAADVPQLNQNTTGNAATATTLQFTPTICSAGQAPRGISSNGNVTGCQAVTGGGGGGTPTGTGFYHVTAGVMDTAATLDGSTFTSLNGSSVNSGVVGATYLPTFGAGAAGIVPGPSAADATKFLNASGTWTVAGGLPGGSSSQVQVNVGGVFTGYASLTSDNLGNLSASSINAANAVYVGSAPNACGSAGACVAFAEGAAAGTPIATQAYQRSDSVAHGFLLSLNGGAEFYSLMNLPAAASSITGLWTGTCSSATFLRGDGTCTAPAGSGNVSNSGTPTSGQAAEWTGTTTIQGVAVTGTGNYVKSTSPTFVTPNLGTPSAVVLTNATGLPVTSITGLGAGVATWLAAPTSTNLAAAVTGETGSGALVFGTAPTMSSAILSVAARLSYITGSTQCLHVDTSGNITGTGLDCGAGGGGSAFNALTSGTNTTAAMVVGSGATLGVTGSGTITATAAPLCGITGLGTGVGTFLATPSSANLATAVTDETGSGALVFGTSPTLTTPALGTPSALVLTNATGLPTAGLLNSAVTLAKIQNATANARLLGSGATGSGSAYTEITVSGCSFSGTTMTCSGGGGGSPAGSNTWVQYNASGSFGANAGFTSDGSGNVGVLSLVSTNGISSGTAPVGCPTTGCIALTEASAAGTPTIGTIYLRADSTAHRLYISQNGGAELPVTYTVASGTATLGTSAISSGACATVVTVAGSGITTADVPTWWFNADVSAVTGYAPATTGGLSIYPYLTSGNFNVKVCNSTTAPITPGAASIAWRVLR